MCYIAQDRFGNYDLAHGKEWKNHKYIRKEGKRYIYDNHNGGRVIPIKKRYEQDDKSKQTTVTTNGRGSNPDVIERLVNNPNSRNGVEDYLNLVDNFSNLAERAKKNSLMEKLGASVVERLSGYPVEDLIANKRQRNPNFLERARRIVNRIFNNPIEKVTVIRTKRVG